MDSERCARFPICLSGESILQLCEERFYGTICLKKLLAWKNSPYRKPLILKGVRQVGKTWILKEFGGRCYENTAYFKNNPPYEVDFLIQRENDIFPVEVKSEAG